MSDKLTRRDAITVAGMGIMGASALGGSLVASSPEPAKAPGIVVFEPPSGINDGPIRNDLLDDEKFLLEIQGKGEIYKPLGVLLDDVKIALHKMGGIPEDETDLFLRAIIHDQVTPAQEDSFWFAARACLYWRLKPFFSDWVCATHMREAQRIWDAIKINCDGLRIWESFKSCGNVTIEEFGSHDGFLLLGVTQWWNPKSPDGYRGEIDTTGHHDNNIGSTWWRNTR